MLGGIMGMMGGGVGSMGFRFADKSQPHTAMAVDLKGASEALTNSAVGADSHFDSSLFGVQEQHAMTDYFLI